MKNKTTYKRSMHNKKHPYTPISAELINNTDLTGEERFLLIYLLGRSNDYILNSSYFAQKSQELFGWGRDKFYKVWTNLQTKGYIQKQKMRSAGKIDGHHYTVHETSDSFLKNQNTENPESGKTGIWSTSALLSIDKPNIDKPIADQPSACGFTKTNLKRDGKISTVGSKILEDNDEVLEIFDLICERNPSEQSDNWKLNDKDRKLIKYAIDVLGFVEAQVRVYQLVDMEGAKPYYSVSYIFSDLKDKKPENEKEKDSVENFLKERPVLIADFCKIEFSDEKVEEAQQECEDEQQFFDFIKNAVTVFHKEAKHWTASEKDLEHCEALRFCDPNIPLAEKLRGGLKSAFEKDEWRFGQIVYQAMTAIENIELMYG